MRYPDQHPSESPSIRLEIRTKAWKQEPQESPGESDLRGASCSGHRKHIETPSISIEIGISRDSELVYDSEVLRTDHLVNVWAD